MIRPNYAPHPAPSTTLKSLSALIKGYPVSVTEQEIISFIVDCINSGGHLPSLKLLATEGLGYSLGEINSAGGNSCNFSLFLEGIVPKFVLRLLNNRGRVQYLFVSGLAKKFILNAIRQANKGAEDTPKVTAYNVTQQQLRADPIVNYFLKAAVGNLNKALIDAGVIDHWCDRENWPNNWIDLDDAPLVFELLKQRFCDPDTGQWENTSVIRNSPAGVKILNRFNNSVSELIKHFGDKGTPANTPKNYWKNISNCRAALDKVVEDEFPDSKLSKRKLLTKFSQKILNSRGLCSLAQTHGGIASLIIKCYPEYEFSYNEFSKASTENSFRLHSRLCQLNLTCNQRTYNEVEREIPKPAGQRNPLRVDVSLVLKLYLQGVGDTHLRVFFEVQGPQHTDEAHFYAGDKHDDIVKNDATKLAYAKSNGVAIYLKPEDLYGPFAIDNIKRRCLAQGLDLDSLVYSPIPQNTLTDYWINEKLLHFKVFTCQ